MNIANLTAHITLNIINLWNLALRGHLNTDDQARDRTRNFFAHENDALTTRPQLHNYIYLSKSCDLNNHGNDTNGQNT